MKQKEYKRRNIVVCMFRRVKGIYNDNTLKYS